MNLSWIARIFSETRQGNIPFQHGMWSHTRTYVRVFRAHGDKQCEIQIKLSQSAYSVVYIHTTEFELNRSHSLWDKAGRYSISVCNTILGLMYMFQNSWGQTTWDLLSQSVCSLVVYISKTKFELNRSHSLRDEAGRYSISVYYYVLLGIMYVFSELMGPNNVRFRSNYVSLFVV